MTTLFENIYTDKRAVSPNEIQFMLKLFQQDLKCVLLDISYSAEDSILLLLNSGNLSCIYTVTREQVTRHEPSNLLNILNERDRGSMRVCDLTPAFLGAVRTVIEQRQASKKLSLASIDLSDTIQKWQASSEPSFVHIRWPNADGFAFLPGNNFSARQYAFLAQDKLSDSAAAVSMFSHWSESECIISQYTDHDNLEIWKENNLQLGFSLLMEHCLRRYDDLAGRSLSLKLEDAINRLGRSHGWNIMIRNKTVDDVHIFDTVDDAAFAYRTIFELASGQINQVIGSRLFNETIDASLDLLSKPLRQAAKTNILVALLTHA